MVLKKIERVGGFLTQVQETEIVLQRQKNSKARKYSASADIKEEKPYAEITTPDRKTVLLSPSALVQVAASPYSKRYSSIRKIDFGIPSTELKSYGSAKKLSFIK